MEVWGEGDHTLSPPEITSALRWAAMRAIFMFHSCEGQIKSQLRQWPQTTIFEEKGEPKQIRTEVLLLTSLTPYR